MTSHVIQVGSRDPNLYCDAGGRTGTLLRYGIQKSVFRKGVMIGISNGHWRQVIKNNSNGKNTKVN